MNERRELAYYNEIDPYAAQWLRNLMAAGQITPGDVDERDIRDVRPGDLRGYAQCHFFAGVGVWSYALRQAGWADDRPVLTCSVPCQPFSAAGRGGGFTDERHLWPEMFRLISECRPVTIFGEQVANALDWLDLVSTDLEGAGYRIGPVDTCAAGFGAPHIRQRLWWVADTDWRGSQERWPTHDATRGGRPSQGNTVAEADPTAAEHRLAGRMADPAGQRLKGNKYAVGGQEEATARRGLADPDGATHGFWASADWLPCRDGKTRPVEPKYVALADGITARMGPVCPETTSETEKVNAQTEINRDGGARMRTVRDGAPQAACPPQGREPGEQHAVELADFVRLLPSSFALAKLHGDAPTTEALCVLLEVSGAQRLVQHAFESPEAAWASLGKEGQDRFRLALASGRWMRTVEFPLTHGIANRVGRLRAYGNALVAPAAEAFVRAYMAATSGAGD